MDIAVEDEGTLGGGLQSGAEGARLRLASDRERVGGTAVTEVGSVGAGNGLAGVEKAEDGERSGQKAEEMRVDLTVVKQEVLDWSEMEEGRWVKQEAEDAPEVKEEKPGVSEVKQEMDGSFEVKEEKGSEAEVKEEKVKVKEEVMDWLDVKEEKKGNLEIKEEAFVTQNIKKEEMMDEVNVKEEKYLPKEEVMDDAKVKEEPRVNPPAGFKRKLAMSRCETCGTEEAKYKCPRCMRYSCSLPCVKKHKAELTCNGVRDKTAYVSIQQFTEMNLLSDYRFLEDVARTADHISRDAFLKRPISNKHMYFMKNRARKQGINLKLLPNGFTKRKENSTFFDKKKQQFCWHVKLQFPQSQAVYIEKRVPDDKTINEILRPYIDPEKSDPVIRQRLKAYIRSQTGVQILMKVEYMQQNLVRYYELDPCKSLRDNLRNKVIIEYPTLHVVLKEASHDMEVLHQVKSESTKNIGNEN
ncbi:box C/D snoRNA protein 1 isoform X1 [Canis lupus familiaris]|uniref:Box C/D snoRNA protein 1 n=2 Tax=Canis lupus TaxID=9612 RepID=A0A8P0NL99_CANLF|nr:box C/D snoRNA protein 1 isoform X1 [Canis lupus dingo]XP_035573080.2 box C/D snoRNA protein 1 isoform X1 [Canis lupus dingo]XP_038412151.1 box C/D snoRNA protein 1 isoform X1 [Canis lupus familiaris]XP_537090.2 box C/D snoRNA protein 1 isoform X1 [Canis lupus familiaris]|eukprot:XP_537090.2 box C/D snoRNA protein 1 isoform X1 [Canis lupus familiaris]